jgi:hypothetical protein
MNTVTLRRGAMLLLSSLTLWTVGCGSEPTAVTEHFLDGTVTSVSTRGSQTHVALSEAGTGTTRILLLFASTPVLVEGRNGKTRRVSRDALQPGTVVRGWYGGGELRSNPPKYLATAVLVRSSDR